MSEKKSNETATKCAQQAELVNQYGARFSDRVEQKDLDTVKAGAGRIREMLRRRADSVGDKQTSTRAKRQQRKAAKAMLSERRKAIARVFGVEDPVRRDFGVGDTPLNENSLESLTSAFQQFISAGLANPDKLKAAAITMGDIDAMKLLLQALESGEEQHDAKTTTAKTSTTTRDNVVAEVRSAMIKVATAATLAYEDQPEVVALFKATLPKARRSGGKSEEDENTQTPEKNETKPSDAPAKTEPK